MITMEELQAAIQQRIDNYHITDFPLQKKSRQHSRVAGQPKPYTGSRYSFAL
ncbi:hypothetical protein JCM18900_12524 [Psychrobacter sp. JCM 18900]|nr:hypothetical protein JCM18900_12524 [Psychrobacter sp. JCM 18900]